MRLEALLPMSRSHLLLGMSAIPICGDPIVNKFLIFDGKPVHYSTKDLATSPPYEMPITLIYVAFL